MVLDGEAIPRHLLFVLETGEIVVQRGANLVELLETRARQVFTDFERDHDVTDVELRDLLARQIIAAFDEVTVWLPRAASTDELQYYFLDTRLSPSYLPMVNELLASTDLSDQYMAKNRMQRIAIMGPSGDPFSRLTDAQSALTLIQQALGEQLPDLILGSIQVNPRLDETQTTRPPGLDELIRQVPEMTMADRSVLIVEDDPQLVHHLTLALQTLGVEVYTAVTGEAALEILLDEEPDLVLVNLMLPDMHGYEVIAKIRKDPLTAQMPIIVMSQHKSEADVVFALNVAKVDEYLVKPFNPHLLRHTIMTLLNRRL